MADRGDVRKPVVAGSWYTGDKEKLSSEIDGYLRNASKAGLGRIRALVSPHAGYVYSGQVAAYSYKQVEGERYDKVIVLAPSHHVGFRGASIIEKDVFRTPLGDVPISKETRGLLKESKLFVSLPEADMEEHSLEMQVPFLQKALSGFELVPLIVGSLSESDARMIAEALIKHVDDSTLVVASTDLSHFYPYDEAVLLDKECMDSVVSMDIQRASGCEMCGRNPVLVTMLIAEKSGWKPHLLKYANSGDVTGDHSGVVGYAAIAFYVEGLGREKKNSAGDMFSHEERKYLLGLARDAINSYVKKDELHDPEEKGLTKNMRKHLAAFVTLEKRGQLRGCIGHLNATQPLYLDVRDNAINAAVHDPRFPPVKEEEADSLEIEISVLTQPEEVKAKDPEELLCEIREGVDGIILECGGRGATYLPQVWEQIPGKKEFLESLCMKAGLPAGSWKKKEARIMRYRVEAFSERDYA